MKITFTGIRDFFLITLGTLITAAAVYFFMLPSHVAVGSLTGIVMVLVNFVPISVSALTLICNILLLIFGFITIGKDFGIKTVYTAILLPILLNVFERLFPNNSSITGDPFLDMLGYVFVVSIGLAILFHLNASSGGLDIVAKFLSKRMHLELGTAVTFSGLAAALFSVLVYDKNIVFLSLIGTFLNGVVLDHFIMGINPKKKLCILSVKREEILDLLLNKMHCGATLYKVYGAYEGKEQLEIITIVNRSDYSRLIDSIERIDPDAFVTVYTVNEVLARYKNREMGL